MKTIKRKQFKLTLQENALSGLIWPLQFFTVFENRRVLVLTKLVLKKLCEISIHELSGDPVVISKENNENFNKKITSIKIKKTRNV